MVISWLRSWIDPKPKTHSRRRTRPFTLRAERLEDRTAPSATLVKDINTRTGDSFSPYDPGNAVELNNRLYFFADDGTHGRELMSTNGTAAGTALVKDVFPGSTGGAGTYYGSGLTVNSGKIFFAADNGVHGQELWVSDGTTAGTHMVKDINPNQYPGAIPGTDGESSQLTQLTAFGGKVAFAADDATHGQELWISDGTDAGTQLVKDIDPIIYSAYPNSPAIPLASNPLYLTVAGDKLFFSADDGTHGTELWVTDGTGAGTHLVKDIVQDAPNTTGFYHLGSYPNNLTAAGGKLFFTTSSGQLWVSDGSDAGTVALAGGGSQNVVSLTAIGNTAYFGVNDAAAGYQLWKSDGTLGGTTLVKALAVSTGWNGLPAPTALINVGGTLYFAATPLAKSISLPPTQLWKSDGTEAGTMVVVDLPPDSNGNAAIVSNLRAMGNRLYFDIGQTLWTSDGTTTGTAAVKEFAGSPWSGPMTLAQFRGKVFLAADDGQHGNELWQTDGTAAKTKLVTDINPKTLDSNPSQFVTIGATTYFTADDGTNGQAIWKTDGTAGGTVLVKTIASSPGPWGWNPPLRATGAMMPYSRGPVISHLTAFHGELFFAGSDGSGVQLWRSDGTTDGTKELTSGSTMVDQLTVSGDTLYYTVTDGNGTTGLWKTDGTDNGATLIVSQQQSGFFAIPLAAPSNIARPFPYYFSAMHDLTSVNETLFFVGTDADHGEELWTSDGTAAGTHMVKDINPNTQPATSWSPVVPLGSNIRDMAELDGKLYFIANDGTHGSEVWTSDGTDRGTYMVKDVNPGATGSLDWTGSPGSSQPNLWAAGGKLYFNADDGVHGQELWISDGTDAGTQLLKDIHPNDLPSPFPGSPPVTGSNIQSVTQANGVVYFSADDGEHGQELWKTDGTSDGTMLLKDIWAGKTPSYNGIGAIPNSSNPKNLTNVNGTLYFTASDADHGTELWTTDGTPGGTVLAADINPGPASGFQPWSAGDAIGLAGDRILVAADDGTHGRELWSISPPPVVTTAPPTVDAGGPYQVSEGGTLQLHASVAGRSDSAGLKYTWDVNGDGNFDDAKGADPTLVGSQLRALNLYGGPDAHEIHVKVQDRAGHDVGTGTAILTIQDAPLTATGSVFDVTEGKKFNRNLASFKDPGGIEDLSHYSATIDWGDGTTSPGNVIRDGSNLRVAGAHAYANQGDYTVQVSISDDGDPPTTVASTIHVHDAGLFASRVFLRQTVGRTFTQTVASFRDRNELGNIATFSATILWGDGSSSTGNIVANTNGGYDVIGTHSYTKAGDYSVRVNINDAGTITTVTDTARVMDSHITARGLTATGTATMDVNYTIAAFRDSDRGATTAQFSASIDWADGNTSAGVVASDGTGGFRVSGHHRYATTGLRSVRVTIQDSAGRTATTTGTVRVMGMM